MAKSKPIFKLNHGSKRWILSNGLETLTKSFFFFGLNINKIHEHVHATNIKKKRKKHLTNLLYYQHNYLKS